MGKKKIQPPRICELKDAKEAAKLHYETETIRLDNEIKKYWETITNYYVKVGMKFDLPPYMKGHIEITNITENIIGINFIICA